MGCKGWLGPWVALAGLINEGMEAGELGMFWGGLWWAVRAGWGCGSLWPDLLMKGWRRMGEGEVGMFWGGLWWAVGAAWGRGSLWPDLLMKGWRRVRLGCFGVDFGGL